MLQTLSGPVRANWIGNYFRSYEEYSPICIYEYNNGWNVGSGSYYKDNNDPRDRPSESYPERTIRGFIWDRRGFADMDSAYKFNYPQITTEPVAKAYHTVLNNAGANYPNPFNPTTTIYFTIPKSGKVKVSVYNLLGQQVAELVNKEMKKGTHKYIFNGSTLSSCIYFYKLESNNHTLVDKMMLLK